jgi:hypothetical protein
MAMTPEEQKSFDDMKAKAETLEKELADAKKSKQKEKSKDHEDGEGEGEGDDKETDDKDLNKSVAKDKKAREERAAETKRMEQALRFNLNSDKFIKEHESILPSGMVDIFKAAEKEQYDSEVEKSLAIKSALISAFFKVQANVDSLTKPQQEAVKDFEKLTVRAREERAEDMFTNVFEPAITSLKQVKKAEELNKANQGLGNSTDGQKKYAEKMIAGSSQHYGVKQHGS